MHVLAIHTSPGGIPKFPRERTMVTTAGLEGDGHDHESHRKATQAVCMIDVEILESMKAEGFDLPPGTMGENLTLAGVRVQECALGDRLRFPSGLEIEITKVRTPCFVLDSISPELKRIMWNRSGMYAKVLLEGTVSPGDTIELDSCGDEPRPALRDVPENAIDGAALLPWA